ncbi:MAG: TrmB family transcriptional regulator [Methanobacteriota archaeon]
MPINGERLETIQRNGLTEYEARTYLSLLDLGAGTARDVANVSRVPRTKIYSVLDALHAKRLVEIIPERPKRYAPVPFREYLASWEEQTRERLKQVQTDREEWAVQYVPTAPAMKQAGGFQVVKGRKNVLARQYDMIQRAGNEILIMGTAASPQRLTYFLPLLREKARDGTVVRIVCPVTAENREAVVELGGVAEIAARTEDARGATIVVVDDREVMLCHPVPDDGHYFKGEDVAIWSDDVAIVADLKATVHAQMRVSGTAPETPAKELRNP